MPDMVATLVNDAQKYGLVKDASGFQNFLTHGQDDQQRTYATAAANLKARYEKKEWNDRGRGLFIATALPASLNVVIWKFFNVKAPRVFAIIVIANLLFGFGIGAQVVNWRFELPTDWTSRIQFLDNHIHNRK